MTLMVEFQESREASEDETSKQQRFLNTLRCLGHKWPLIHEPFMGETDPGGWWRTANVGGWKVLDQSVPLKKDKKQTKKPPNPRVLLLACCCSVIFQVILLWTLAFGLKLTVGVGALGVGVGGWKRFLSCSWAISLSRGRPRWFL